MYLNKTAMQYETLYTTLITSTYFSSSRKHRTISTTLSTTSMTTTATISLDLHSTSSLLLTKMMISDFTTVAKWTREINQESFTALPVTQEITLHVILNEF